MPAIYMPPKIEIVETIGTPEYYAEGATFRDQGEVMTGVYFTERTIGGETMRVEVLRIHFSRSRWLESFDRVVRAIREKSAH